MATRTLPYSKWLREVARHGLGEAFLQLSGQPVADVAVELGVSTQRVYQLIEQDALDLLQITTRAGKVSVTLVTQASIERYLADRVPDRNRQGYFAFQA